MPQLPLIQRKLLPPTVPTSHVRRQRLIDRLAAGQDPRIKLTLVSAGPGYGKSTLVADYVADAGVPGCWLNLEPHDADPSTFLSYVIGGCYRNWPGEASRALELLHTATHPAAIMPSLMGLFAEELSERVGDRFILVLDDFHAVQHAEPVVAAVEALIAYLPEAVQLIVVSRNHPPFKLPQLRVRQQLIELGMPQLRFSLDEIASLFRALTGMALSPEEQGTLSDSTEGWAASLVMAAYAVQGGSLAQGLGEGRTMFFEYLAQEVFDQQKPAVQEFLLRTALLPTLDVGVCREELGLQGLDEMIAGLLRSNLLLTRASAEATEYYYHPMLQAFLKEKARAAWSDAEIKAIAQSLATRLQERAPEDALRLFLEGGLWTDAVDSLGALAPGYLAQGRVVALEHVLSQFPAEILGGNASLNLYHGEVCRALGRFDEALRYYETAEHLANEQADRGAEGHALAYQAAIWGSRGDDRLRTLATRALELLPESDRAGRAFAENALGLSFQMANDMRLALSHFERARELFLAMGDAAGLSKALHNVALATFRQGDIDRARATYKEAIRQAERAGRRGYPATYSNLAIVHLALGEFDEARTIAEEGLMLAQALGARRDEGWTLLTLGEVASAQAQPMRAIAYFNRTREVAVSLGDRVLEAQALSGEAEVARLQGQRDRAWELMQMAIALRGLPVEDRAMVDFQIPLGVLCMERGEHGRAQDLLRLARETLASQGYRYRLAQLHFYEARLSQAMGQVDEARAIAAEAKELCEANGYQYLIVTQGGWEGAAEDLPPTLVSVLPQAPDLRIRALGDLEVAHGGGVITPKQWQGTKTKLLLACLLQHRQGVTREQLAEELYGEEEVSRSAILMLISRLRQALEPDLAKNAPSRFVQWRDGRYWFNFDAHYALDTEEFAYHLLQARADGLSVEDRLTWLGKAVDLYRGRYMNDLGSSGALWLIGVQEHLHQQAMAAYGTLFEYLVGCGRHEEALARAEQCLSVDRCAEFAHQAKMRALLALGNRSGALRHYQQLLDILDHDLGIAPDATSRRLFEQIQAGVS
jgi:ATP/maltotriose-dependent transcriptional regulator MalT/DNA-binding SARP family transcriptional activator